MARGIGHGGPYFFKCSGCRRAMDRDVDLTGRIKVKKRISFTGRNTRTSHEYRCRRCEHVGWSSHRDLEEKAKRIAVGSKI